ncbi:MAG: TetR/AcrR family transcriptional regulator [Oscillospiraceae bacterium]|nr:TetR/AcrR family transcriptional regulator [Oscillospiraceae bacterium]
MQAENNSRRALGTEFLKECIADALIRLMEQKPYDKITVREITDCANVGRATYFRRFSSKDDVLSYKIKILWRRWEKENKLDKKLVYTKENFIRFFEFIYSVKDICAVFLKAEKLDVLILALSTEFGIGEPSDPEEFYRFKYVMFGIVGVLTEWIKRNYLESPKEMIDYLSGTIPMA